VTTTQALQTETSLIWIRQGLRTGSKPIRHAAFGRISVSMQRGTTVVSTGPLNYYVRVSCKFDASGNPSLDTTVTGDNEIGLGTTKTSADLKYGGGECIAIAASG
jgi:hypothetical protein